jgi:hypothetical protein
MDDPNMLGKYKGQFGEGKKIANHFGATYEIISNTPIPPSIKTWLDGMGITYIEILY